jgi:uncharacterized protein YoxC
MISYLTFVFYLYKTFKSLKNSLIHLSKTAEAFRKKTDQINEPKRILKIRINQLSADKKRKYASINTFLTSIHNLGSALKLVYKSF